MDILVRPHAAVKIRNRLERLNMEVNSFLYDGVGHQCCLEEVMDLISWIRDHFPVPDASHPPPHPSGGRHTAGETSLPPSNLSTSTSTSTSEDESPELPPSSHAQSSLLNIGTLLRSPAHGGNSALSSPGSRRNSLSLSARSQRHRRHLNQSGNPLWMPQLSSRTTQVLRQQFQTAQELVEENLMSKHDPLLQQSSQERRDSVGGESVGAVSPVRWTNPRASAGVLPSFLWLQHRNMVMQHEGAGSSSEEGEDDGCLALTWGDKDELPTMREEVSEFLSPAGSRRRHSKANTSADLAEEEEGDGQDGGGRPSAHRRLSQGAPTITTTTTTAITTTSSSPAVGRSLDGQDGWTVQLNATRRAPSSKRLPMLARRLRPERGTLPVIVRGNTEEEEGDDGKAVRSKEAEATSGKEPRRQRDRGQGMGTNQRGGEMRREKEKEELEEEKEEKGKGKGEEEGRPAAHHPSYVSPVEEDARDSRSRSRSKHAKGDSLGLHVHTMLM